MGCQLEAIGFNSTIRIPAKIKAAPANPTFVTPSFAKTTAVARANTGSKAKITAVRVALVYRWPHVWRLNATAVAKTPVRTSAITRFGDQSTRAGSHNSARLERTAAHKICPSATAA